MSITLIIIIGTVITSIYAWNNTGILSKMLMNPYSIKHKNEYYRFITSGLVHNDYIHLLFNMITLYFFGDVIEQIFRYLFGGQGSIYFIVLYFLGMIVSDLPTYFKYRNNVGYNSLGASGAVSAVVFSSILFNPTARLCLYFAICVPGFIFGAIYLIYSYYQGRRMADHINHDAHFYGAVFGIIFSIIIHPPVIGNFISQISEFRLF